MRVMCNYVDRSPAAATSKHASAARGVARSHASWSFTPQTRPSNHSININLVTALPSYDVDTLSPPAKVFSLFYWHFKGSHGVSLVLDTTGKTPLN